MKKLLFLMIFIIFSVIQSNAQVGINTNGSTPDRSAMPDVKSAEKGLLPPRMTNTEIGAIATPDYGLTVCNTETH